MEFSDPEVTDAGLKELNAFSEFQPLGLDGDMQVTDAGMKELEGRNALCSPSLHSTEVTEKGLKKIQVLKQLRTLDVRFTKVTDSGLAELEKALPALEIAR